MTDFERVAIISRSWPTEAPTIYFMYLHDERFNKYDRLLEPVGPSTPNPLRSQLRQEVRAYVDGALHLL